MQSLQTYLQCDYIHMLPFFYFTSSHDVQVFNEGNCQQHMKIQLCIWMTALFRWVYQPMLTEIWNFYYKFQTL